MATTLSQLRAGGTDNRTCRSVRVAILCDYREEGWPSMDLVADMLVHHLNSDHGESVVADAVAPVMPHLTGSIAFLGKLSRARTADRAFARFWHYPSQLRKIRNHYDVFHIIDHSYAHLVLDLPPGRVIVTCHDLDAFRCLLEPDKEPRSLPFRQMTRRILRGLRRAAWVTCDSEATRRAVVEHQLFPPARLSVVRNGVHPAFSPHSSPPADAQVTHLLRRPPGELLELLHVGSTIPRKRIEVLLQVFASLRQTMPALRLLRVGGDFTAAQESVARSLGIREAIDVLPRLSSELLAAVYRRASLLLQPSKSEGFGLPVIEAMACGTPVVASDIPVLREVGGDAAHFCPLTEIDCWVGTCLPLLQEKPRDPQRDSSRRALAIQQSQQFRWSEYASRMVEIYERVANQC